LDKETKDVEKDQKKAKDGSDAKKVVQKEDKVLQDATNVENK
jgi:hypothetical protein